MELRLFLLADYANLSQEGKLNVMGIFDRINANRFPARHPEMYIVVRLRAELGEGDETRTLTIKLLDEDGAQIGAVSQEFQMSPAKSGYMPEANFMINLRDVMFPQPGRYEFVLLVDKESKGSMPLDLILMDVPEE
jgi:hypothetical protein